LAKIWQKKGQGTPVLKMYQGTVVRSCLVL
jgi:hypothetical protein